MATPETKENVIVASDLSKWRLKNERGRQTWWYDADGEFDRDSNFLERHSLGLDTVSISLYAEAMYFSHILCTYMYNAYMYVPYAHTMHMYLMHIQCICTLCTYNAYVPYAHTMHMYLMHIQCICT